LSIRPAGAAEFRRRSTTLEIYTDTDEYVHQNARTRLQILLDEG